MISFLFFNGLFSENALKEDRVQPAIGVYKKLVCQFSYSWKKRMALTAAQ